jgi:hypothetical protein
MSAPDLLSWAVRVAGVGLAVTGAELVPAVREAADWQLAEGARARLRVRGVGLAAALVVDGLACAVWPEFGRHGGGLVGGLLVLAAIVLLRPMGDGADLMLALVLLGVGARDLAPTPWLWTWVGWCLAVNVCLSYWWSGVAKLRLPAWRSGRALALILNSRRYGRRRVAWLFLDNAWLPAVSAWAVMTIEGGAPVFVAIGGWVLLGWAVLAAGMHLSIMVLMGLPRFFWAFGGALLVVLAVRGGAG